MIGQFAFAEPSSYTLNSAVNYNVPNHDLQEDILQVTSNTEGKKETQKIPSSKLLFNVIPHFQNGQLTTLTMTLKPTLSSLYDQIGLSKKSKDIVFVYPIFTQAAYGTHGFYDYYNKKCDTSCLRVQIPTKVNGVYSSSIAGALALKLLQYPHVTDVDVDKNPDILKKYKRVIMLHNEYVTKKEFDAVTSHPDVIYMYPNAMYAQVKTNYTTGTLTLVKGHGYPSNSISNGFGWKFDNSKYEYDTRCDNWNFSKVQNGFMLNCYPEYRMLYDVKLLQSLQLPDSKLMHK
ncbi:MAG TPA: N,N-dimethylformamidase beta subunit family domain-containing protein [Candidatus Nitrosotalea sp.]|nr:N,N-dimethylformamidase beta subunit family domain-containing protein [Candidatus Nitrosotalea sp.]